MEQDRKRSERYPIGIQTFEEIIKGDYVYVDKTRYIHELIKDGGKYYFLSRPRRFGKSLFISTLEAFFEGRRELFKGLEIDRLWDDWTPSPVLRFDLNSNEFNTPEDLQQLLLRQLAKQEQRLGVSCQCKFPSPALFFGELLEKVYEKTGRRVVVLVDEYDKPLLSQLDDEKLGDRFRSILKGFYGNLKSGDRYIRFAMLTGVSRFSKVSIFSDLNNLNDISMDGQFATMLGVTERELADNFPAGIRNMGEKHGLTHQQTIDRLRYHYDGYHFAWPSAGVYNPFSLLNAFSKQEFGDYWFATGTTTSLARRVRGDRWSLPDLHHTIASPSLLANIDTVGDPVPLLYQTGYLTLKDYEPLFREYTLGYPNEEVRRGFTESLFEVYVGGDTRGTFDISRFRRELYRGDTEGFMGRLTAMFAAFPYDDLGDQGAGGEYWFRSVVYTIFMMVGQVVRVETHTARGRSDMEVFTDSAIYVFEFKYGAQFTPEGAVAQICEKGYAAPYAADIREKVLIGAVFNPATRSLAWAMDTIPGK